MSMLNGGQLEQSIEILFFEKMENFHQIWMVLNNHQFIIDPETSESVLCVICSKLLIDACSAPCKCKYCFNCISGYLEENDRKCCPGDGVECKIMDLDFNENVLRDYEANVKVSKLYVKCPLDSCQYFNELSKICDHLKICEKRLRCCPFHEIGCTSKLLKKENLSEHLCSELLPHSQYLIEWIVNVKTEIKSISKEVTENAPQDVLKCLEVLLDFKVSQELINNENLIMIEKLKNELKEVTEKYCELKIYTEDLRENNMELIADLKYQINITNEALEKHRIETTSLTDEMNKIKIENSSSRKDTDKQRTELDYSRNDTSKFESVSKDKKEVENHQQISNNPKKGNERLSSENVVMRNKLKNLKIETNNKIKEHDDSKSVIVRQSSENIQMRNRINNDNSDKKHVATENNQLRNMISRPKSETFQSKSQVHRKVTYKIENSKKIEEDPIFQSNMKKKRLMESISMSLNLMDMVFHFTWVIELSKINGNDKYIKSEYFYSNFRMFQMWLLLNVCGCDYYDGSHKGSYICIGLCSYKNFPSTYVTMTIRSQTENSDCQIISKNIKSLFDPQDNTFHFPYSDLSEKNVLNQF